MQIENLIKKLIPSLIRRKIEGRPNLQKILANTGWLFFDKILRMGVGLFVGVWVARYLGPEQFGVLSYAQAFVALFAAIATLGLDNIVVRDIVKNPEEINYTLGTAFILKLTGSLLALGLTVSTALFMRSGDTVSIWLVGIIAAGNIFQSLDVIDFWFQSQIMSKYSIIAKNVAFGLVALLKLVFIITEASLIAFAIAGFLEMFFGGIGLLVAYKLKGLAISKWKVNLKGVKQLLRSGAPLFLSSVVVILYMRIDQVMLRELVGDSSVGIYSAAVRLVEVWYFIPVAITASVFPIILKAKHTENVVYEKRLQQLYDFLTIISICFALLISFLSKPIVVLIYGSDYYAATQSLEILSWSGIFVAMSVSRSKWIIAEGLLKYTFLTQAIGALSNIVLNLILIPKFGANGAAVATLISYALAGYFSSFLFRPLFKSGLMLTKSFFVIFRLKTYLNEFKEMENEFTKT